MTMNYNLTGNVLRRLCTINFFEVAEDEMLMFGLRGCLPLAGGGHNLGAAASLYLTSPDYVHPRCTIGQWLVAADLVAAYPGSTVPHRRHVVAARTKKGRGTNELMTGRYADYRKGWHKAGSATGHEAFRQGASQPVRRTVDDVDYDTDDRVEYDNVHDNIHAAWCMGVDDENFASAGCQVVVGYPACAKRGQEPAVGPWAHFQAAAYGRPQQRFGYLLLGGHEAAAVAADVPKPRPALLRYGSRGDLVAQVQNALAARDHYEGVIDGDFGYRTLRALLGWQSMAFPGSGGDGIVGPMTAASLALAWPTV
jgi:hypothetical protein